MNGVEFVFFDLDDTLLDHRQAEGHALADLHGMMPELAGLDLDRVRAVYRKVNARVWHEYSSGVRDKEGTRSGRFELLFDALSIEADAMEAAHLYLTAYGDHWTLIDGALDACRLVSSRYPTGLLTNGFAEAQRAKLARFPELAALFHRVVISEEEGVMKPDPRLFELAGQRVGADAAGILYVGDSLRSDILGGLNANWRVAWYTEDPQGAPEGVPSFSDWSDFASILGL